MVSFSFSITPLYSSSGGVIFSPSINVGISALGEKVDFGSGIVKLNNQESKLIKVISGVGVSAKAYYYSGPFANIGPIPPKAGQKTSYTVTWSITNTSNNISKTVVRSSLPPWAKVVGSFVPENENFTYNSTTKEIIWNAGMVPKGAGITSISKELSFKIEITPSTSQLGSAPTIMNETVLTGHDDFANVNVKVKKPQIDTRLLNDAGFPMNGERVVE